MIEAAEWIGMQMEYDRALGLMLITPGRAVRFTRVAIASRDIQRLWNPIELEGKPAPRRRGPREKIKWSKIKLKAMHLLRKEGVPGPDSPPGWQTIAAFERELQNFCNDNRLPVPEHASIYPKVIEWIDEFRQASTVVDN